MLVKSLESFEKYLEEINITFDSLNRIIFNGVDVSSEIRKKVVTTKVSKVSSIKEVRKKMVYLQRKISSNIDCVIEGRDIGTVVFPQADCKFFVEASPETRARRRFAESQAKDPGVCFEEILEALKQRDEQDRNRSEAPLRRAVDAILVDTSNLNVEQALSVLEQHLRPFLLTESS